MLANAKVVSKDSVVQAPIDDEILLLDVENGVYFGVTGTGTRIWELLAGGATPDSIVDRLAEEYDVQRDELRRDVEVFLRSLQDKGLIREIGE